MQFGLFPFLVAAGVCSASALVWLAVHLHRSAKAAHAEREDLRSRVAEIAAMAGGLAHEIKNPLSTIGMNAQLLDESIAELSIDPQDRARIGRRIGTLTRETERLRGILEDFLDYAGEMRLSCEYIDLAPIIEELADFYHPEADRRQIRIRIEPPANPISARVDVALLKQAILNLMINASQAMENAPDETQRELIIRLDNGPNAQPRIQIIDTGPGIGPDQVARVFEPYFTTKIGGTGLGLPTTRRIIEAHGGTLSLTTELGQGTAFAITLPQDPPAESKP